MTEQNTRPPSNAKRVYRWTDLPAATEAAAYRVYDPDQEPRTFVVSKHMRQVLEGLMQHPIYAASYCRISDQVLPLRRDHGVSICCDMFSNDVETGRSRFGVYVLESKVERVTHNEEDAA
ncbi:MAG: hypothetical protein AAFN63_01550 [Pseudomonadota bacterium]